MQGSETRNQWSESKNPGAFADAVEILDSGFCSLIPEKGGRKDGTEPVNRFGEWTKDGRCIDF